MKAIKATIRFSKNELRALLNGDKSVYGVYSDCGRKIDLEVECWEVDCG